jgi:hypothetical protein
MMSQNTKVVSTLSAGGIEDLKGVYTCETDDVDGLKDVITYCLRKDTAPNRALFDDDLNKRTVTFFVDSVLYNIAETNR